MSRQKRKSATANLKWITERETALSILKKLAELGRASRYDLASKLDVSYATVMNYVEKFKDAGLIEEIGEVEAERGGKKVLFRPKKEAMDLLSEVESPKTVSVEILHAGYSRPSPSPLGALYSLTSRKPKRKGEKERRNKVQDILDDMRVDVAVVVNYRGNPIPIMPISTLGGIDQVSLVFSEKLNQRIQEVAVKIAKKLAEAGQELGELP